MADKVKESERFDRPEEWADQQNAMTSERGYGPQAKEQKPENPVIVDDLESSQASSVPAVESGPHLRGRNLELKRRQLDRFAKSDQEAARELRSLMPDLNEESE